MGCNGCKHAVAVVAEYLKALADERSVPLAAADDPRWAALTGADQDQEDEADEDDFGDEEEDDDTDEAAAAPPRPRVKRESRASWDDKIWQLIDAQSRPNWDAKSSAAASGRASRRLMRRWSSAASTRSVASARRRTSSNRSNKARMPAVCGPTFDWLRAEKAENRERSSAKRSPRLRASALDGGL